MFKRGREGWTWDIGPGPPASHGRGSVAGRHTVSIPFPSRVRVCAHSTRACADRRVCTHTAHSGFSRVVLVTVRPLLAAVCPSFVLGHVAGPASHRGAGPVLGLRGLEPRAGPGWLLSS